MKRVLSYDNENCVERRIKRAKLHHETTIDYIPVEVLLLVFKYFSPSERRNLMTVRTQWLNIVNHYFSQDNFITLSKELDYSTNGALYRTFSTRKYFARVKITDLWIKSFPMKINQVTDMLRFIELISDEVKSFRISFVPTIDFQTSVNFFNELYMKLPHLEKLIVSDECLLGNLDFPQKLKSINIQAVVNDTSIINKIRNKENKIEFLTSKAFKVNRDSYHLVENLVEEKMNDHLKILFENADEVRMETKFNFCGKTKLTCNDITTIRLDGVKVLFPAHLREFTNVSQLSIVQDTGLFPIIKPGRFMGIKRLDLVNYMDPHHHISHLSGILPSFPDCELLKIDGYDLKNEHFTLICQFMPKMRELLLPHRSQISIDTLLSETKHSLKDLQQLERLSFGTNECEDFNNGNTWPKLPKLHTLSLTGNCFEDFDEEIYAEMARNCPKIRHLKINTEGFLLESQFLPMLKLRSLRRLVVPGNGCGNRLLVSELIKNCQKLKDLTIQDDVGLSLEQEMLLFDKIPTLASIRSVIGDENANTRNIDRKNLDDLKKYLTENLHQYSDLQSTVQHVIDTVISIEDFMRMLAIFAREHPDETNERIREIYIVTKFLGMGSFQFCRLVGRSCSIF